MNSPLQKRAWWNRWVRAGTQYPDWDEPKRKHRLIRTIKRVRAAHRQLFK